MINSRDLRRFQSGCFLKSLSFQYPRSKTRNRGLGFSSSCGWSCARRAAVFRVPNVTIWPFLGSRWWPGSRNCCCCCVGWASASASAAAAGRETVRRYHVGIPFSSACRRGVRARRVRLRGLREAMSTPLAGNGPSVGKGLPFQQESWMWCPLWAARLVAT